jgi:uncharacterized membrane protein YphA (DoxX/SURF4 family)
MPRSLGPIPLRPREFAGWPPMFWLVALGALFVRLYLATLWLRFGMAKVDAGWLTLNPVRGLLTVVGGGQTPMPIPRLSVFANWLLAVRADVLLSVLVPLTELALAAAFFTGWYVRQAAFIGIAVNTALILGGLASVAFDGKIIALQVVVLVVGRRASVLGVPGIARLGRWVRDRIDQAVDGGAGPEARRTAA